MPIRAPAWAPPLLAVQLLTRLPVPFVAGLDAQEVRDGLTRTLAWMPLVGTLIGAVTAGVYAAALLFWPPMVAAGVALMVEAVLTGALHEDAVADFCDAFGGAARGDEARRIMRDSRVGSYGALGLVLLVGTRWTATAALPQPIAAAGIIAAATIGRSLPAGLLALAPPCEEGGCVGASVGMPTTRTLLLALLTTVPAVVPLALAAPVAIVVTAVAVTMLLALLARAIRRRLGGSTGDCLGFAVYLGQLACLLAAAAT